MNTSTTNQLLVVLGAAESGVGAAVLAVKKGLRVFVSDSGAIKDEYKRLLQAHNIEFEEGIHSIEKVLKASEIVKSPGIPNDSILVAKIIKNNIPDIASALATGQSRFTKNSSQMIFPK